MQAIGEKISAWFGRAQSFVMTHCHFQPQRYRGIKCKVRVERGDCHAQPRLQVRIDGMKDGVRALPVQEEKLWDNGTGVVMLGEVAP